MARQFSGSNSFLKLFHHRHGLGESKAQTTSARFLVPLCFFGLPKRIGLERLEPYLFRFYLFGKLSQRIPLLNIRNKMTIGSRAGLRFKAGLPVRGQRTRTNASTANSFFSSRHYFLKSKF